MFSVEETAVEFGEALIDRFGLATLILDQRLNIRLQNSAAERLIERADGIDETDGRLTLCCPNSHTRLSAVLEELSNTEDPKRSASLIVPRSSNSSAWVLTFSAITLGRSSMLMILLTLFDPLEPRPPDPCLFQTLYGLSHAEARVLVHLGSGQSIANIAKALNIQPQTARTHLKAVFRKMGLHRQQELVRTVTLLGLMH